MISPLAYIDPSAKIGDNVEIGPFCYIDKDVEIGNDCKLMHSVSVMEGTRMGSGNTVFPGAVLGAIPQDLKFVGEKTTLIIGDNNRIRENVTMNRGTASKGTTIVGSNNLFMESMHVAHDCVIGNYCIIGNGTKFGGEVVVDDHATISANVLVHQFCHIGGFVMVQGGSGISKDIPPFVVAGRNPVCYEGINIVRLKRMNFSQEDIYTIHNAYRMLYNSGLNTTMALAELKKDAIAQNQYVSYIISFIEGATRGIIRD
ncbi:MAG: acyl-ACP--UDP-N-acetylglucosamine O-acyltransferase [Bacteroidaceae bacterium]|nr:acyl-ACP--UDP-N-acetylglucosamine O-acyltransferase [Bacteroidaceae bacterium]